MKYTDEDVKLLAKCAWMEARGEGIGGCYLVMHVVVNRVGAKDFPKTLKEVIYQKNAFSWTMPSDPQYGKEPPDSDPTYQACLTDAPLVLAGDDDPTKGAHYYYNPKTATSGWFVTHIVNDPVNHPETVRIGKHVFYV